MATLTSMTASEIHIAISTDGKSEPTGEYIVGKDFEHYKKILFDVSGVLSALPREIRRMDPSVEARGTKDADGNSRTEINIIYSERGGRT